MKITLKDAAMRTGMSKSTLSRAIAKGRISAEKSEFGQFLVEPSELFRVFPPIAVQQHASPHASPHDAPRTDAAAALDAQIEGLRAQLALMHEHADDLKAQRDSWQRQAEGAQRLLADQRPQRRGLFGFLKAG